MRKFLLMMILLTVLNVCMSDKVFAEKDELSIIIEVDGEVEKHRQYIEDYWPTVEIVGTYSELFQGLALKIPQKISKRMLSETFIQGVYPVKSYEVQKNDPDSNLISQKEFLSKKNELFENINLPMNFNDTKYTGKGVKVAVIDTGIDRHHPDLKENYKGGFDLVDLDDDPMETTLEEGLPTVHGSHVAGIIAANGTLKGVAPEAEIYAYRALGPGGMGTSIQVIAAIEEAVKEGVDVINLSLGASVNGPDYPTSKVVNEASKRGIAVVVANGNTGPSNWTVGAPATASSSISVGAYESERIIPYLYEPINQKKIHLKTIPNQTNWNLQRDDQITTAISGKNVQGKILLVNEDNINLEKAFKYDAKAMIADEKLVNIFSEMNDSLPIPIAFTSEENIDWMKNHLSLFYQHQYEKSPSGIAMFSSRGPVINSWEVKPDIIAPGVNIISTVPNGYAVLSGTSMAAPHISGAIAIMKEAKRTWSNEKIMNALKTTALKADELAILGEGAGLVQIQDAIDSTTIIHSPVISLGKIDERLTNKTIEIVVENTSNDDQSYTFKQPKKERGIHWDLPSSFTVKGKEKKRLQIKVIFNEQLVEDSMIQGRLTLMEQDNLYEIPYFTMTNDAENPIIAGFSLHPNEWNEEIFNYELYITKPVKFMKVFLYNPDTMMSEGLLWETEDMPEGLNKGEIPRKKIKQRGQFNAIIVVQLESGEIISEQTTVNIN